MARDIASQLTLQEARENCGKTIERASELAGVPVKTIKHWEVDATHAEMYEFLRLLTYYKTSVNHVYAGRAEDVYKARREAVSV
ncbi:helix-turn-helix transcriptional regulator [Paenibacillus sp. F4]|uniref:helix-turn-helix domain-containing protein n=1 Tax=Paenibacillus sp. F4 TaxID=357385 RepID=UPI000C9EF6F3|nr:helix-turn-helix transcriptional regulator [Paenibacillus sp. F4]PNQ78900.1 hypothetical protein C1T21_22910 [Paenibacillus sp. F4]